MSNRHTILRISLSSVLAIVGLSLSMLTYGQDASSSSSSSSSFSSVATASGNGSITIEQSITGVTDFTSLGEWTLMKPGYIQQNGKGAKGTVADTQTGSYTLFIQKPEGMSVTIRLVRNGTEEKVLKRPQITFPLNAGDNVLLQLTYELETIGKVGVQSNPAGVGFDLYGPNGSKFSGYTPASFDIAPIGQYQVVYEQLEGCPRPPAKSLQLASKSRVVFDITLQCKGADDLKANPRSRPASSRSTASSAAHVTNSNTTQTSSVTPAPAASSAAPLLPGQMIDVPPNAWFAPYIYKISQRGIITGYKDENGRPTGMFGPANLVTLYELSVVAHRIGKFDQNAYANVRTTNTGALNYWFTPYWTSAEERGWTVYQDPLVDPLRFASRAEVVTTLLQALDIPVQWQKGDLFTDVTPKTPHAAAIETAARIGMVEGRKDANGKPLRLFVPYDAINRAELAKLLDSVR